MDRDRTTIPSTRVVAARLAPFVAWLATQEPDERTRRYYREAIEQYLMFAAEDDGPDQTRSSRFLAAHPDVDPGMLGSALARLAEHDQVVALTLDR